MSLPRTGSAMQKLHSSAWGRHVASALQNSELLYLETSQILYLF